MKKVLILAAFFMALILTSFCAAGEFAPKGAIISSLSNPDIFSSGGTKTNIKQAKLPTTINTNRNHSNRTIPFFHSNRIFAPLLPVNDFINSHGFSLTLVYIV